MAKPIADDNHEIEFPSESVTFDPEAFDTLIRTQGVDMVHYRAMVCPIGKIDPNDVRHPRDHHANCSNGYIYRMGGTVICSFISNSKEQRQVDIGRIDGSTVTVTFPRYYEKCNVNEEDKPVRPAPFDRVYLKDESITVETWEEFACSATGLDKLRYPATFVEELVDSRGNFYSQGTDFCVSEGRIKWHDGRSPGIDPISQKGVVCSVRYAYRPFWYVARMVHEVRVAQVPDEFGDRQTMRFPQQMVLQREVVFENEQRDLEAKKSPRQNPGPDDSSYSVSGNLGTK